MRGLVLLALLVATALAAECTKDTCVQIMFSTEDYGVIEHTAPSTISVNGEAVSTKKGFQLFTPGNLKIEVDLHSTTQSRTRVSCLSWTPNGNSQMAKGLSLDLLASAGQKYHCTARTWKGLDVPVVKGAREIVAPPVQPDVSMVKGGDPNAEVGSTDLLQFSLAVTNAGAGGNPVADAFNIVIIDNVDTRLIIKAITPNNPFLTCDTVPPRTVSQYGNNITCTLPILHKDEVVEVLIQYLAPIGLSEPQLIRNFASVSTNPVDTQPSNNVNFHDVLLVANANLNIAICCSPNVTAGNLADTIYTTTVCNAGLSPAVGVVVNITLPVEFDIRGQIQAVGNGAITCVNTTDIYHFRCTGFDLAKDQCQDFRYAIRVGADKSGPIGATVNIISNVSSVTTDLFPRDNSVVYPVLIKVESELRITKSSNDLVTAGEFAQYGILVTNAGPSFGYTVRVFDDIPSPFIFVNFTTTQGSCSAVPILPGGPANRVLCELGNVATRRPGGETDVNITFTIYCPPGATPTITSLSQSQNFTNAIRNDARVNSVSFDPDLIGNIDEAFYNIIDQADVEILKSCQQGDLVSGSAGPYSFFLDVWNNGPSSARTVVITDAIPSQFILIGAAPTIVRGPVGMTCANYIGNNLRCTLASPLDVFPRNQTSPIRIRIDFSAATGIFSTIPVPNTGIVTSTTSVDLVETNNNSTCITIFVPSPDVTITKGASADSILVNGDGSVYYYSITVINNGPGTSTNVRLNDTFDGRLIATAQNGNYVSAVAGLATFQQACLPSTTGNTVSCVWSTFPVGSVTIRFPFIVPNGQQQAAVIVPNCAYVSAFLDRDPTNNEACKNITLNAGTSLRVQKGSSLNPVCAGTNPALTFFTIDTTNIGPATARNVRLVDQVEFPFTVGTLVNVTLLPSTVLNLNLCNINATAYLSCAFGDMLVNQTIRVVFGYSVPSSVRVIDGFNTATASTDTFQISTVNNRDTILVPICNLYEPIINKTGEAKVVAGQSSSATGPYKYTLTFTNNGPSDADTPTIVDILPSGFRATSYAILSGLGQCSITINAAGRSVLTCQFPGLFRAPSNPGPRRTEVIDVFFSVDESTPEGTYTNCVDVSIIATPSQISNNSVTRACWPTYVDNIVDLVTTKTGPLEELCANEAPGVFAVSVYNKGPSRAYVVQVVDTIPQPLVYVPNSLVVSGFNAAGAAPSNACSLSADQRSISCSFGSLKPNPPNADQVVTFTYSLRVEGFSNATNVGVTNVAVASSGCSSDPTSFGLPCIRDSEENVATLPNNTATFTTRICARADLQITKSSNLQSYVAGANETRFFTLSIRNNGPATSYNVTVTDSGFTGGTFTSIVSTNGAQCNLNTLSCTYPSLASGATDTITLHFTVAASQPCGPYDNNATISSSVTLDQNLFNNNANVRVNILNQHDIQVRKTGDVNNTAGGNAGSFSVAVVNANGPSNANNVRFYDQVPQPLRVTSASSTVGTCSVDSPTATGTWVRCNLGVLIPNASAIVSYTYSVESNAVLPPSVTNTASAFSSPRDGQTCANAVNPVNNSNCESEINFANNCDSWTTVLLCSSDLTITKTDFQTTIIAGSSTVYNYTIVVRNNGPSTARAVQLVDSPFPFAGMTPNGVPTVIGRPDLLCNPGATGFTCGLGDIIKDGELTIVAFYTVAANAVSGRYNNTACVSSTCRDVINDNCATDTTEILNNADLQIIKDDCTGKVVAGATIPTIFTFTVTNAGPSRGVNVLVFDTVPAIYNVVSGPNAAGYLPTSCSSQKLGGNLGWYFECKYATFPVDAVSTITVEYTVNSTELAGWATNCARVRNDVIDPNLENNVDCDTNEICTRADLQITKKLVEDVCIVAGDRVSPNTYEVKVTNLGPSTARSVIVHENFPVSAIILTSPAPCTVTIGTNNYTCVLNDVNVNVVITLLWTFRVAASQHQGIIINQADTHSLTFDPDLCNNNVTLPSEVCVKSDLGITKTDGVDVVVAGERDASGALRVFSYNITGTNYGPSDAYNVVITDVWPEARPGFILKEIVGATCTTTDVGYSCNVGDLPVGHSYSFCLKYTVDPCTLACELCNTATIRSPALDSDAHPNTATDCTRVRTEADLSVCKSDGVDVVTAGEVDANGLIVYTYTIVVTNNGPSCAQKVNLLDIFPTQVVRGAYGVVGGLVYGSCVPVTRPGRESSFSCNLLTLKPFETRTVTASYTVPANVTTCSVTNVVTVDSTTFDPKQCNNDFKDTNALVEKAVLAITKTSTTNTIVSGFNGNNTFTIFVWNKGPSWARDVVVTDTWPSGLVQYPESISAPGAVSVVTTGGDLTVRLGDLAVGIANGKTITIPYSLMDAMGPGPIVNSASVFSPTDVECRTATHTTTVVAAAQQAKKRETITEQAQAAPTSAPAYQVVLPTHAPTSAPIPITEGLAPMRVAVRVDEEKTKNSYTVTITNPNHAQVRIAMMELRIMTPTSMPVSHSIIAVSKAVKSTTCDSMTGRKFGTNWAIKCTFVLAEDLPTGATVQVNVDGTARTVKGVAPVLGSSTI